MDGRRCKFRLRMHFLVLSFFLLTHPNAILYITIFHSHFLQQKGQYLLLPAQKTTGRQCYRTLLLIAPADLLCPDAIGEVLAHTIIRRDIISAAIGVFAEELGR